MEEFKIPAREWDTVLHAEIYDERDLDALIEVHNFFEEVVKALDIRYKNITPITGEICIIKRVIAKGGGDFNTLVAPHIERMRCGQTMTASLFLRANEFVGTQHELKWRHLSKKLVPAKLTCTYLGVPYIGEAKEYCEVEFAKRSDWSWAPERLKQLCKMKMGCDIIALEADDRFAVRFEVKEECDITNFFDWSTGWCIPCGATIARASTYTSYPMRTESEGGAEC